MQALHIIVAKDVSVAESRLRIGIIKTLRKVNIYQLP